MSALDNYDVLGYIGSGSFGKVSKIRRKEDGKILVWKEIHFGEMSKKERDMLAREVQIIRDIRNPYIVKYYDRVLDHSNRILYIIMEYCPLGDLWTMIKKYKDSKNKIGEDLIWLVLTHMCLALYECHSQQDGKILHRDIKPGNILLRSKYVFKLGDFGLARILSDQSKFARSNVGTPYYMSPEQIDGKAYNEKSDIWSLGCVLYELCMLRPPFIANNTLALALRIRKCIKPDLDTQHYSSDLTNVINSMMEVNPDKRPDIGQLMKLPQVSVRIWEIRLQEKYVKIRTKEEDVRKREISMDTRQRILDARERDLEQRELDIQKRERNMRQRQPLSRAISLGNILNDRASTATTTQESNVFHHPFYQPTGKAGTLEQSNDDAKDKENIGAGQVSAMFKNFRIGRF